MLRLPRKLHFEVHKVLRLHNEICTSRFTKYCACHGICTSRFTKYCDCHKIWRFTSAAPVSKFARRGSQSAVSVTKSALRGSQSAVPATKSANEPHAEKLRFTAPVTKSERLDDHHHVEVKQLRSLPPVTKSRLSSTNTRGFPCTCHEK